MTFPIMWVLAAWLVALVADLINDWRPAVIMAFAAVLIPEEVVWGDG